jgi:hypothetical protein
VHEALDGQGRDAGRLKVILSWLERVLAAQALIDCRDARMGHVDEEG